MSGLRLREVTPACLTTSGRKRQGQVDAVLHQHLGEVQIHAGLERDGQGVRPVVVRLGHHVHHVFDAVDLLLDGAATESATTRASAPG